MSLSRDNAAYPPLGTDSILRAYSHVCETMYTQAALGAGDAGIVVAEEAGIEFIFRSEGVKEWWAENPFGFSRDFRRYMERFAGSRPSQP